MIDFAEVSRWVAAIDANEAEASWMVAADWFEENGEDALAAELREVQHRDKACHLIRDRFFGFHPARNVTAANARQWFDHLTPVVLAAWASRQPGELAALSRRPVRVIQRPDTMLSSGQGIWSAEWARVVRNYFRDLRIVHPDGRRWHPQFTQCDHPIPLEARGPDGTETRHRTIHVRFYVGHVPDEPESPRYVLWPLHPTDVRVRESAPDGQYPSTEDVTGLTHPDQWGDLFTRPAPTDQAMDRELMRLVDPMAGTRRWQEEYIASLARANGVPAHLIAARLGYPPPVPPDSA